MDAQEFRDALKRLDVSQTGFARAVGASPRTVRDWVLGGSKIPPIVAKVVRLLLAGRLALAEIEEA